MQCFGELRVEEPGQDLLEVLWQWVPSAQVHICLRHLWESHSCRLHGMRSVRLPHDSELNATQAATCRMFTTFRISPFASRIRASLPSGVADTLHNAGLDFETGKGALCGECGAGVEGQDWVG